MKKVTILLINLLLLFCLSSCATVKKDVVLSQERTNVQAIEFYHSERAYDEGNIHAFLEENEPVAALESETFTSFLDALCNLEFEEEKVFFPMPLDGGYDYKGYIIAVVYSDGGYDLIAEKGLYSYTRHDEHRYNHADYSEERPWAEFVEEYIPAEQEA